MLILRGVRGILDAEIALEYAARRGYAGLILDDPAAPGQLKHALDAFRMHPEIEALYGFSGGGYTVRHILHELTEKEKARLRLVVVIGAPNAPESHFKGSWELVYHKEHNERSVF